MTQTLEEYQRADMAALKAFASDENFKGNFGISRIQRYLRIGYNRASYLAEAAVKEGVLVRCESPVYHFSFSEDIKDKV